jgi:hypothetical protein
MSEEECLTTCVMKVRELGTDFFRQDNINLKDVFNEDAKIEVIFNFENSEVALVDLFMFAESHNLETTLMVPTTTRPIDDIIADAQKLLDSVHND